MYSRTCFFGRTSRDPHERFEVRVEVRVQVQVPPTGTLPGPCRSPSQSIVTIGFMVMDSYGYLAVLGTDTVMVQVSKHTVYNCLRPLHITQTRLMGLAYFHYWAG